MYVFHVYYMYSHTLQTYIYIYIVREREGDIHTTMSAFSICICMQGKQMCTYIHVCMHIRGVYIYIYVEINTCAYIHVDR